MSRIIREYEIPGTRKYNRDGSGDFSYHGAWVIQLEGKIRVDYLTGYSGISKNFPLESTSEDWEAWLRERCENAAQERIPVWCPWDSCSDYWWKWRDFIKQIQIARGLLSLLENSSSGFELQGGLA